MFKSLDSVPSVVGIFLCTWQFQNLSKYWGLGKVSGKVSTTTLRCHLHKWQNNPIVPNKIRTVHKASTCDFDHFIHLICNSRHAGHRVGEYLEKIMPLIVKFCRIDDDDELREYCIQVGSLWSVQLLLLHHRCCLLLKEGLYGQIQFCDALIFQ